MTEEELRIILMQLRDCGLLSLGDQVVEQDHLQRLTLAEELIRNGRDPQLVSRLLHWQEFEEFIEIALDKNAYRASKHIVFKSSLGRREIDVLAWNNVWILAIDCKHWSRNLSHSRLKDAAAAQTQRARALAGRPDILQRLGVSKVSVPLVPLIISLGEFREHIIDRVPIVAISAFASFLHEASPRDESFKAFTVRREPTQRSILSMLTNPQHDRRPNLAQGTSRRRP